MALSAAIQWEVRPSTGGANNGGGFKAGASGTDYSQQASPHVVIDGATITAVVHTTTTQINVTGYTVAAGDVGNVVCNATGTATKELFEITVADTGNNRWTIDRSAGTAAQTIIGNMGGARSGFTNGVKSLQGSLVANQKVWVKTESGWNEQISVTVNVVVEGYKTTRGDAPTGADRPRLDRGGSAGIGITSGAVGLTWLHIISANSAGECWGLDGNSYACHFINCRATGSGSIGFNLPTGANGTTGRLVDCESDGNVSSGFSDNVRKVTSHCYAHHNVTYGFQFDTNPPAYLHCVAACNDSSGFSSAGSVKQALDMVGCASINNGGYGLVVAGFAPYANVRSCDFSGNASWGTNTYDALTTVDYNNFYNNTSGDHQAGTAASHDVAVDPGYADISSVSITDLAIDATDASIVTSSAHPFTASDVGKYLRTDKTSPGSGFRKGGWYVVSVDGSNKATLDGVIGTTSSTSGVAKLWTMDLTIGQNLVSLGWPAGVIGTPTVGYADIGAIQAEPPAGGAGGGPIFGGHVVR